MIEQATKNPVSTNIETEEFRIKSTPKAFSILSDKLYTYKKHAIIRELATNAYDAHVAAGKADIPFDVTIDDTVFKIRDYGIGMSEEDVLGLYSTYFDSNKNMSNDFIGTMGLGSKSPFALVKIFTVISYYNGVQKTYTCFLNEDNIPSIAKIFEKNTTEENGVEISFSIESNDVQAFIATGQLVFASFKNKPNFVVNQNPVELKDFKDYTILTKGNATILTVEGYSYRDDFKGRFKSYFSRTNYIAKMGNILYPIDFSEIDETTQKFKLKNNQYMIIKFNVGDLDIHPSREMLNYNNITKKNIIRSVQNITRILKEEAINILKGKNNIFEIKEIENLRFLDINVRNKSIEMGLTQTIKNNIDIYKIEKNERNNRLTKDSYHLDVDKNIYDFVWLFGKTHVLYVEEDRNEDLTIDSKINYIKSYMKTVDTSIKKALLVPTGFTKYFETVGHQDTHQYNIIPFRNIKAGVKEERKRKRINNNVSSISSSSSDRIKIEDTLIDVYYYDDSNEITSVKSIPLRKALQDSSIYYIEKVRSLYKGLYKNLEDSEVSEVGFYNKYVHRLLGSQVKVHFYDNSLKGRVRNYIEKKGFNIKEDLISCILQAYKAKRLQYIKDNKDALIIRDMDLGRFEERYKAFDETLIEDPQYKQIINIIEEASNQNSNKGAIYSGLESKIREEILDFKNDIIKQGKEIINNFFQDYPIFYNYIRNNRWGNHEEKDKKHLILYMNTVYNTIIRNQETEEKKDV